MGIIGYHFVVQIYWFLFNSQMHAGNQECIHKGSLYFRVHQALQAFLVIILTAKKIILYITLLIYFY